MSLVWHIAKKDLRRLAWPVGLWCGFIVATALWFRAAGPSEVRGDADINAWLTLVRDFGWIVVGGQFVVGYVLAGSLLLEDAPTGTNGFWLTRPVSGARMAGGKLLAAAILFVIAPTLALTPVWLASGFGLGELLRAQGSLAASLTALSLGALAMAALGRDLAGFLARTVIGCAGLAACAYVGQMLTVAEAPALGQSRLLVAEGAGLAVLLAAFLQQFVGRHTARASLTIACGLIGCVTLRVVWPWDITNLAGHSDERADERGVPIEVGRSFSTFGRNDKEVPFLRVHTRWSKDGFYVPVSARSQENRVALEMNSAGWHTAGLRALEASTDGGALSWQLFSYLRGEAVPRFNGELEVWRAHARVTGELPLREGAELSDGSSRTRIVGFARDNDRLDAIYLQENEFATRAARRPGRTNAAADGRYFEQFILVDRAAKISLALSAGGLEAVELNAQHLGFRRLFVPGEHDWSNGVLVRVVFERDQRFWRPIEVEGVTVEQSTP